MADEAAQDIEALNLRDKDRDDSERRDEVRDETRVSRRHFFSNRRIRFFETGTPMPSRAPENGACVSFFFRRRVEPFDGDSVGRPHDVYDTRH